VEEEGRENPGLRLSLHNPSLVKRRNQSSELGGDDEDNQDGIIVPFGKESQRVERLTNSLVVCIDIQPDQVA